MNEEKKTGVEELCATFSDMGCTKEEADTIIGIPGMCLLGYVLVVVTTPLWIIPYLIFKRRR